MSLPPAGVSRRASIFRISSFTPLPPLGRPVTFPPMTRAQLLLSCHGSPGRDPAVVVDVVKLSADVIREEFPLLRTVAGQIEEALLDYWRAETVTQTRNE